MSDSSKRGHKVTYQRGSGNVEMELSRIQSCLEDLDPKVSHLDNRVDVLESKNDKLDGKLVIIVWLVGINVSLVLALIIGLFNWGLNHLNIHADMTHYSTQQNADVR